MGLTEDVALQKFAKTAKIGSNSDVPRVRLAIAKHFARASNRRFDGTRALAVPYLPADESDKIDLEVARLLREDPQLSQHVAVSKLLERGSYVCSDGMHDIQVELGNVLEA